MNRKVLVTGSNGYLGGHFIDCVLNSTDWDIVAMSSKVNELKKKYTGNNRVFCYSNDCLKEDLLPNLNVDAVLHLAFARRFSTDAQIAESVEFSRHVFQAARNAKVKELIYVSTQGVYGNTSEIRNVATTIPSPAGLYTLAKYATESVLYAVYDKENQKDTAVSIIRLDSIAGNQKMLPTFVKNSIEKHHIHIVGGKQIFSFMDVRDAASGLVALLNTPVKDRKKVYNLGWNCVRYNIMDLAQITGRLCELKGFGKVTISLEEKEIEQFAGMDSSQFLKDTGWTPRYNMEKIISNLFDEYIQSNL